MKKIKFYWVNQWSFFWTGRPFFHLIDIEISFSRVSCSVVEFSILGLGFSIWVKGNKI